MAFHSGLSCAAIAQIESGRRRDVRLASLVALARALGTSVDYLAGNATAEPKLLEHRVLLYDSDDGYLATAVPFLRDGMARGEALLAVAPGPQAQLLRDALGDAAGAVEVHDAAEWYSSPIAALGRYRAFVHDRFEGGAHWARVIAAPVWDGRSPDEAAEWTRYESIVNLCFASAPATIICAYDTRSVSEAIVAAASHTHPGEGYREPEDFLLALP